MPLERALEKQFLPFLMKGKGNQTYYTLSTDLSYNEPTPHINPSYKGLDALPKEFPKIPEGLKKQVISLQKRSSNDQIKHVIKDLCSLGSLRPNQLSRILNRDARYLRDYFLSKMEKEGELTYQYPDQPAHPKQAYKTPSPIS